MRNTVSYEWDYEQIDEHGDIIEHNHADTLQEFNTEFVSNLFHEGATRALELVLIRDTGNETDGLQERTFAYVKDGQLPEYFKDGAGCEIHKVPARFRVELSKYLAK